MKSEGNAESAVEAAYDRVRIDVISKGVVMKEDQTEEQRESLAKSEYKILNIHYSHNSSSISEAENKIKDLTKSYQKAAVKYEREIEKLYRMWDTLRIENSVFSELLDQEKQASKFRLESLQSLVLEEKNRSERLIEEISELEKQKEGWEWIE
jgi:chromosome segregation ATPase